MIAPLAQVASQTWRCRFDQCPAEQRATNGCHQNCNFPGSPRQVQCRGALGGPGNKSINSPNENEFIWRFPVFLVYFPPTPSSHHIGPPSVGSACNRLGTVACESANMYDAQALHHDVFNGNLADHKCSVLVGCSRFPGCERHRPEACTATCIKARREVHIMESLCLRMGVRSSRP
jgi:hypothetical protein